MEKVIESQLYTWLLNVLFDQNYYLFIATLKSFPWIEYLYPLAFKCTSQLHANKFLKEINHRVSFLVTLAWTSFNILKGPLGIKMVPYCFNSHKKHFQEGLKMLLGRINVYSFLRCNGCHFDSIIHFPKVKVFNYNGFHWFLSHRNYVFRWTFDDTLEWKHLILLKVLRKDLFHFYSSRAFFFWSIILIRSSLKATTCRRAAYRKWKRGFSKKFQSSNYFHLRSTMTKT